jgi:hypothetical protein
VTTAYYTLTSGTFGTVPRRGGVSSPPPGGLRRGDERRRPKVSRELRQLIRRMSKENALWGAPRVSTANSSKIVDFKLAPRPE